MSTPDMFPTRSSAVFSRDRTYRYRLSRTWSDAKPLVFLMLNPSTADEETNDPTVERCERRAREYGCGGLEVVNLFALRSTDPQALYTHPDPIGPENDAHIVEACRLGMVVCGWGQHGRLGKRGRKVRELLCSHVIDAYALHLNCDGSPTHPLYVPYTRKPALWCLR